MFVEGDSFVNEDKESLEVALHNMENGHGKWAYDSTKMDNSVTNVEQRS